MSLYWMSSPYENEYGAWDNEKFTANQIDFADPGINQLLKLNHQNDIDEFTKFKGVQKDDAYRSKAIQNIKAYPFKYVRNIYANISRMLFGFPGNYAYQRPLMKIWYSSVLFTLMLFSFILSLIHWKKLHFIIRFLAVFALIYLGGTSLLGVGTRQFIIIIPALLFWIAYVMDLTVVFNFRFRKDE
ncbi:MAG: hypothetical protein IPH45_19920 [Bacteroidales bacterium]|nr:hypothetical protein [Bacteroidales bacterium]